MMQKLNPNNPETKSLDLVAENIARLKALFPEVVTEGPDGAAVNVDVLKALVGDKTVTDCDEKYGLNWHGKRRARQLALTPSTGTLRPCPEDSVDWDTTQNLIIEGDNLEVLKLLQKSYAGKVKLIYIDPPYNTGKDFVYRDDFQDNIKNYLELTGQVENGRKISSNKEASGRFHTGWLNMMYPRLKLAQQLLRPDGVIFVSLDDTELSNLSQLLDELFGPENFVGRFIWRKKYTLSFRDEHMIPIHEYVVCYKGRGSLVLEDQRWDDEETVAVNPVFKSQNARSTKVIRAGATLRGGGNGMIAAGEHVLPSQTIHYHSDAVFADGKLQSDVKVTARFAVGQDTLDTARIEIAKSGAAYVVDGSSERSIKPISILFDYTKDDRDFMYSQYLRRKNVSTRQASSELDGLLVQGVFDNPKPVSLIAFLTSLVASGSNDIVVDFFAGSGTTGHAVMAQNVADEGNRRYILVQLPEPLDPENKDQKTAADFCDELGKPRTIAELTKERLRRAAKKIKEQHPDWDGDTGFRVFKLDSSNIRAWEPDRDNLDQTLLEHTEHIKHGRSEQDILYELLLKLGLDLCVPIETKTIAGKAVHSIGGGVLLACLATQITREDVEPLAQGIVDWHQELDPAGDTTCVFRDSAFADDVAKTNLCAILEQHGITNVRSL
jgi:adenine-specific DNA-methyltransferase